MNLTNEQKKFAYSDNDVVVWVSGRGTGKTYGAITAMINASLKDKDFIGVFATPSMEIVRNMARNNPAVSNVYNGHFSIQVGIGDLNRIHIIPPAGSLREKLAGMDISWLHFDEFYLLPDEEYLDDDGNKKTRPARFPPPEIRATRYTYATSEFRGNAITTDNHKIIRS